MLEIQPATILWTIVNLLVLYFFFKKFLFGRVNEVLDRRAALVKSRLDEAEVQKAAASKLAEEYRERLSDADTEAAQIVNRARAKGQREYETLHSRAEAEANRLRQETREQLAAEREEMLRGARREVASLALLTAAKLSGRMLDEEGDGALLDAFLTEDGETP